MPTHYLRFHCLKNLHYTYCSFIYNSTRDWERPTGHTGPLSSVEWICTQTRDGNSSRSHTHSATPTIPASLTPYIHSHSLTLPLPSLPWHFPLSFSRPPSRIPPIKHSRLHPPTLTTSLFFTQPIAFSPFPLPNSHSYYSPFRPHTFPSVRFPSNFTPPPHSCTHPHFTSSPCCLTFLTSSQSLIPRSLSTIYPHITPPHTRLPSTSLTIQSSTTKNKTHGIK